MQEYRSNWNLLISFSSKWRWKGENCDKKDSRSESADKGKPRRMKINLKLSLGKSLGGKSRWIFMNVLWSRNLIKEIGKLFIFGSLEGGAFDAKIVFYRNDKVLNWITEWRCVKRQNLIGKSVMMRVSLRRSYGMRYMMWCTLRGYYLYNLRDEISIIVR